MLLDIRRMFSRYDGPVHCEETVSMEGEDFPGYTIEGPVHAAFCATLHGAVLQLEGRLDTKELLYTELVLHVPGVLLCSEDCAGLCPVCGCRKPCSCKHETSGGAVDERLAILQQLLSE